MSIVHTYECVGEPIIEPAAAGGSRSSMLGQSTPAPRGIPHITYGSSVLRTAYGLPMKASMLPSDSLPSVCHTRFSELSTASCLDRGGPTSFLWAQVMGSTRPRCGSAAKLSYDRPGLLQSLVLSRSSLSRLLVRLKCDQITRFLSWIDRRPPRDVCLPALVLGSHGASSLGARSPSLPPSSTWTDKHAIPASLDFTGTGIRSACATQLLVLFRDLVVAAIV